MTKIKFCQWCGEAFDATHRAKIFCTPAHKNEFGNFMAARGKVLMPLALAWRTSRGRKGVGSDALKEMVLFLDGCAAELHGQGAPPMAGHFQAVREAGISTVRDFPRNRPSRQRLLGDSQTRAN